MKKANKYRAELNNLVSESLKYFYLEEIKKIFRSKKTYKRIINYLKRKNSEVLAKKNGLNIIEVVMSIKWIPNKMYGGNPILNARIIHNDPESKYNICKYKKGYSVSGTGYDKQGSVVSKFINDCFANDLWNKYSLVKNSDKYTNFLFSSVERKLYIGFGVSITAIERAMEEIGYSFDHINFGDTEVVIIRRKDA